MLRSSTLLILTALTLAACGRTANANVPPATGVPALQDRAEALGDEVADAAASLTLDIGFGGIGSVGAQQAARPSCVTVSPAVPSDADGDGIPDDATYTLNCARTGPFFEVARAGTWRVRDVPNGLDVEVNETTTRRNLATNRAVTIVRTGTRSPRSSASGVTLSHRLDVARTVAGGPATRLTTALDFTFTPTAGTVDLRRPVPAGTLTVSGTWTSLGGTAAVSTPVPLRFDPACDAPTRIVAGTLRTNAFDLVFGPCGEGVTVRAR